jgi:hypothetical protein
MARERRICEDVVAKGASLKGSKIGSNGGDVTSKWDYYKYGKLRILGGLKKAVKRRLRSDKPKGGKVD